uniref:G_PROTEIN_RECEP_F1_2 domain-containing protein n=1 Tax=Angiostrongylus cantonensis TaxID=6313 RepID=A0A158P7M7_ANGCA
MSDKHVLLIEEGETKVQNNYEDCYEKLSRKGLTERAGFDDVVTYRGEEGRSRSARYQHEACSTLPADPDHLTYIRIKEATVFGFAIECTVITAITKKYFSQRKTGDGNAANSSPGGDERLVGEPSQISRASADLGPSTMSSDPHEQYEGWTHLERRTPFQGYRTYVALTYISFNIVGFVVNLWVLYVVAPLLFAPAVKVPKSILFFIFALVVGDLTTMIGESMRST